jgi:hypothetical protein
MLKSTLLIFICFCCCFKLQLFSQHALSKYERNWMLAHPFLSAKIYKHLKETTVIYKEVKLNKVLADTIDSGGKLDAFRHTFTMAYLCRYVKVDKLRKLGQLHEKGNKDNFLKNYTEYGERADSLACEMDLRNNELGFTIGVNQKELTISKLKLYVLEQIMQGNAWYFKKNSNNSYLSCQNDPINIDDYKNVWYIPKCLTQSE